MRCIVSVATSLCFLLAMPLAALAQDDILNIIDRNDSAALAELIASGADVNAGAGDNARTLPLVYAAAIERADMMKQLIEAGADITAAQPNGRTPMMAAASSGSIEVLNVLLALGVVPTDAAIEAAMNQAHPGMVALVQHAIANPGHGTYDAANLGVAPEMSESLVMALQVRLILMGYHQGGTDGNLDDATVAALSAFNEHAGISPKDEFSATTLVAMNAGTHPECHEAPVTLSTNVHWAYQELVRHGCIAADAGLNEMEAVTETRGGLGNPYGISCEPTGQLVIEPETWLMIPVWSNYVGEFKLANLRIDGCAMVGDIGFVIGAGSTVTFEEIAE